jgi:general secretion pathway protein H
MIAISETGSGCRSCARARRVRHSGGFSLIELLVVLTIMVALASLLPLALEHMVPGRKLAAASQQLASTLRDLQSVALATGKTTSLFPEGDRYATRGAGGTEKVIELPARVTVRLQDDLSGRVLTELTFYPDGSSSGGRFEVQFEDKRHSVLVTRLVGRVREDG